MPTTAERLHLKDGHLRPQCLHKCGRRNPISYGIDPEEAWKVVTLNRRRIVCPSCFDTKAEKAGVR